MLLFNYYKTRVIIWLPWLFHIKVLGMTTQEKYITANSEYTDPNSKTTIHLIHICLVILIVSTSTKHT
jgi:hypothetical protein